MKSSWSKVVGLCGGFAIIAFAVWTRSAVLPNNTVRLATCMPNHCFCEAVSDGVPRQNSNTWSSLAFVLAGIALCATAGRLTGDAHHFTLLYAASLYVVGLGSAYYHALLTFSGQVVDVLGMYLVITAVICFRQRKRRGWAPWIRAWIVLNCVGLLLQILFPSLRRYIFAATVLVLLVDEIRHARERSLRFLWMSLAVFSLAALIWVLDITGTVCQPSAIVQGHAAWHALGAVASVFLYWHTTQEAKAHANWVHA
jgi:hypothetical protein